MYCPKKKLKIQQHPFFIQELQNQSLYLNSLLSRVGAMEHKGYMPPKPRVCCTTSSGAGDSASPHDSPRWECAEWLMPASLTPVLKKFWDYALRLRWDLSAPLAFRWRREDLTRSTAGEQSAGYGKHEQESMKPSEVMRKEATFTRKRRRRADFKNKATKSVLPRMLFDVNYCYRNERNLGFMSLRRKDEKISKRLASNRHLSDTENKYLKIILTGFGNQPAGFWRVFLRLLVLACKREVHQEQCWKRVLQWLANILTVF